MRLQAFITSAVAALALAVCSANAADLYSNSGSAKDTPGAVVVSSIAGPYVEVAVGPSFSSDKAYLLGGNATLGSDGGVLNGRAGYDLPIPGIGKRFGVGVWGEVGDTFSANGNASVPTSTPVTIKWNENLTYGGGGKVFYDHGSGQIYAILGYAASDLSVTATKGAKSVKDNVTADAVEWGAGISLLLVKNVYAKLEFNQLDYNSQGLHAISTASGAGAKIDPVENRVLFGIGISLGSQFAALK